jgi:hypothetical protein
MLREYLEDNTTKTIFDFFVEFKSSDKLQQKFTNLQNKE